MTVAELIDALQECAKEGGPHGDQLQVWARIGQRDVRLVVDAEWDHGFEEGDDGELGAPVQVVILSLYGGGD